MRTAPEYIVGIDTGGTFTDITVMMPNGEALVDKVPTTPWDFSQGVVASIRKAAEGLGLSMEGFLTKAVIKHGSTVATNALITRDGARVGLVTTRGFEDTIYVMRAIGRVAGLSELAIKHQATATKPIPVVPKRQVRGLSERVDYAGNVIVPLNEEQVRDSLRYLVEDCGVEAIAVSLLWSFMNPAHERRVQAILFEMYGPDRVYLSLSSELAPVIREYARSNTVVLDCFLGPKVRGYVESLENSLRQDGYVNPLFVMQANGGLTQPEEIKPMGTTNSGPAGGMIASKFIADMMSHKHIITSDMGGTSFDVGLLVDRMWRYDREPVVERFHITWPMIDTKSIGAGGGTIAWVDPVTRQLGVGPHSAGASPGPVCYDAGGTQPTITDCNLLLGYLNPQYFLGGRITLNRAKAEAAIEEHIARPLGISVMEAAASVYELINGYMSDLIRKQVVTTGHLPQEFQIYAFGGAGPVHAAYYGASLGVRDIWVFPTSSVFSAFGIAAADLVHTATASYRLSMPADPQELNHLLDRIEDSLREIAQREGIAEDGIRFHRTFLMRYRRQLNEIDVQVPTKKYNQADVVGIMAQFERRYEEVYGEDSGYQEAGMELISIRVDLIGPIPKPVLRHFPEAGSQVVAKACKGTRPVFWRKHGGLNSTAVYDYDHLRPGNRLEGPCIVETPITTVVIPPGCQGEVDPLRSIRLVWGV